MDAFAAAVEGDEAQAVGEHLVLDDRGVVLYEDVFDGQGWDLGDEDAPEGVCERGVDADEGEGGVVGLVSVELDGEGGLELLNGEGVVFAREVTGEVCGRDIGDCLFVDANRLDKEKKISFHQQPIHEVKLADCHWTKKKKKLTFRRRCSSALGAACREGAIFCQSGNGEFGIARGACSAAAE